MNQLSTKVNRAIQLIRLAASDGQTLEVAYSGGKDSDVILHLTRMAGVPHRAIYKNTTIDPPGTIAHCRAAGVEMVNPRLSFFELIQKKGFPSRQRRFCCRFLKEYKILDRVILGIRRDESAARAKRYTEPTVCRIYRKGRGKQQIGRSAVEQFFPILDWSLSDLREFVSSEGIPLHPLYYRDDGSFDLTRRLGCLGCPFSYVRNRIAEFRKYPRMVKLYIRGGKSSATIIQTPTMCTSMPVFTSISPPTSSTTAITFPTKLASFLHATSRPSSKTISTSTSPSDHVPFLCKQRFSRYHQCPRRRCPHHKGESLHHGSPPLGHQEKIVSLSQPSLAAIKNLDYETEQKNVSVD